MSLKENLDAIKQEISAEEQFLESVIKGERFYKKYKKLILSGAAFLIVLGIGYSGYQVLKERNLKISNSAYETLLKNPKDSEALNTLKEKNENLYMVFEFQMAVKNRDIKKLEKLLKDDTNFLISDISSYEIAQEKNIKIVKSKLLKGFALLEEGFELLKEGKKDQAELKFAQISPNSGLKQIAKNLSHYQGK